MKTERYKQQWKTGIAFLLITVLIAAGALAFMRPAHAEMITGTPGGYNNAWYPYLVYTVATSKSTNTSYVTATLFVYDGTGHSWNHYSDQGYYSITVGGSTYTSSPNYTYDFASVGENIIKNINDTGDTGSHVFTVPHDSNGNANISISAHWHSGNATTYTPGDLYVSATISLPHIDVVKNADVPYITEGRVPYDDANITSGRIGRTMSIWTNSSKSSSVPHRVWYTFNGVNMQSYYRQDFYPGANASKLNSAAVDAFISRLYLNALGRTASSGDINAWAPALKNYTQTGEYAVHGVFGSPEYSGRNRSNSQFIYDVYRAILGRDPDSGGYNTWLNELNAGRSREDVFYSFTRSTEFDEQCSRMGIIPCGGVNLDPVDANGARCNTWTTITPGLVWAYYIPNSTYGTLTIYENTYTDGSMTTQVGSTQSTSVTLAVPDFMVPTVNGISVSSNTRSWRGNPLFVSGRSAANYSISASGSYGSTIANYKITLGSAASAAGALSSGTTSTISQSGYFTPSATVTDSRGRPASGSGSQIYVYPDQAPYFTRQPSSVTVNIYSSASFSVTASSIYLDGVGYQWYYQAPGTGSGTAISGATGSSLTLSNIPASYNGGSVYCVINDGIHSAVASSKASIRVTDPLFAVSAPASVAVAEGDNASFAVKATGSSGVSYIYQWYLHTAGGSTAPIAGSTGSTLTLASVPTSYNGAYVFCRVNNSMDTKDSATASITVYGRPSAAPTIKMTDNETGAMLGEGSWTNHDVRITISSGSAAITGAGSLGLSYTTKTGSSYSQTVAAGNYSAPLLYGQEGKYQIAAATFNTSVPSLTKTATATFNIDKTAPVVSLSPNTTAAVPESVGTTVTVTASDALSGLPSAPYSWDGGMTWQSENTTVQKENGDVTVLVRDNAGNVASQMLTVRNVAGDYDDPFHSVTDISGYTFGSEAYMTPSAAINTYTDYITLDAMEYNGLAIHVTGKPKAGSYLKETVSLMGAEYPFVWDDGNRITPFSANGTAVIDPSELAASSNHTSLTITAEIYADAPCTQKTDTRQYIMTVAVDVTPPDITPVYDTYLHTLNVSVIDRFVGVQTATYTLQFADGSVQAGDSNDSFSFTVDKAATLDVTATDLLGNRSSATKQLVPAVSSTGEIQHDSFFTQTRRFWSYLFGGNRTNQ